jgi:hypothetical protein
MKTKILLSALLLNTVFISYGQWIYKELSAPRGRMGTAVLGNKVYFAGGRDNNHQQISDIQVYDWKLEDWDTTLNLSVPRVHVACIAAGSKVFFAGGANWTTLNKFDELDIWDTLTMQWTYDYLTEPRVFLSAVTNGEKVLFAGGTNLFGTSYNVVEIFDAATGSLLTTTTLSQPRSGMGAAVIGDLAFFAGGAIDAAPYVTDRIDIYHFSTDTWTTDHLSEARGFLTAVTVGNKVLFAGGTNADNLPTDRVDIYDASDSTWKTAQLSEPRALFPDPSSAVLGNRKAYFSCGGHFDFSTHNWGTDSDVIDIYDDSTGTWSYDRLTQPLLLHAVAGVGNQFIVAGGGALGGLFYDNYTTNVEIYIDTNIHVGIDSHTKSVKYLKIYPNPCSAWVHLEISDDHHKSLLANVFNMQGQMVFTQTLHNDDRELNLQLPDGVYVLRVVAEDKVYSELITILK